MNVYTKPCPFCGEQIQSDALKCRYCREWVGGASLSEDIPETEEASYLPHSFPLKNNRTEYYKPSQGYIPPQLAQQDFNYGKAWSLILILLPAFWLVALVYLALIDASGRNAAIVTGGFLTGYAVVGMLLLNEVNTYMQNFSVSQNLTKNILCVQLFTGAEVLSWFLAAAADWSDNLLLTRIMVIVVLVLLIAIGVSLVLTGIAIYNARDRDFIGGSSTIGVLLIVSVLFNLLIAIVPFFTYGMFSKAQRYSERNGFLKE